MFRIDFFCFEIFANSESELDLLGFNELASSIMWQRQQTFEKSKCANLSLWESSLSFAICATLFALGSSLSFMLRNSFVTSARFNGLKG